MTDAYPAGRGSQAVDRLFPRVLIVDDDKLTCLVMRDMASTMGLAAVTAGSLTEARAELARAAYDLVLIDLYLPDGQGLELIGETAAPCIVITSRGDSATGAQAIESGALDFLLKPFDGQELAIRLSLAAERLRLREFERQARRNLEIAVEERTRSLHDALRSVERLYLETTDLLASALEARDAETHHHSMRVASYSVRLATLLGIEGDTLRQIEWGALLHDVGKIAVPDHVLRKEGPLTPAEREVMNQHPDVGYRMVRKVGFLNEAAELVLAHQERVDGSGYPRGLTGENIPLSARIFAVADTADAITSDRPYRAARSFAAARLELKAEAGRTLDRRVVDAWARLSDAEWEDVRRHATHEARRTGISGEYLRVTPAGGAVESWNSTAAR